MKKKLCFPTVIRAVSYCELGQNSSRLVIIIFRQTNRLVNSCNFCKFAEFTIQTMLPFTIHFSLQCKYLTSPEGKQNPNTSDYRFLSFHIDPILVTQRKQNVREHPQILSVAPEAAQCLQPNSIHHTSEP